MRADALRQRLQDAMRAGDKLSVDTLRMLLAAVKQKEIDSGGSPVDDDAFGALVRKLIKQRRESADQYSSAGREELADREIAEIGVLEALLPPPPDDSAVDAAIQEAIAEFGALPSAMGKIMGRLKSALPTADMSAIGKKVREQLSTVSR